MKQQLLMRRISVRTGSEGPQYDLYSYTEITISFQYKGSPVRKVTIHSGLGAYLKLSTNEHAIRGDICDENAVAKDFKLFTGLTPEEAEAAYRHITRRPRKCQKCGCKSTRSVAGYPGEYFELCSECNEVRGYEFCRAEIE